MRARRTATGLAATSLLVLAAAALAAAPPPGRGGAAPATAAPPPAPHEAVEYVVDAARSTLTVLAYRAGPLARLGHDHVLVARGPLGRIEVPADPAGVRFVLSLPLDAFVVDDPAARAAEGPEFADPLRPADVEAVRRNLLGPRLLDAARHPELRLTAAGARGGPQEWRVPITVEIAGRANVVDVPVRIVRGGDELVAEGSFALAQTALGLKPLRVALGAVQVRDEMTIRFRVVAVRAPSPAAEARAGVGRRTEDAR